jgi:hypothetical protein
MIKLLMSWNINENKEQEHLEFVTSVFVPLLMKHGAISDAWLSLAGSSPEMIMGIVGEDELELRAFIETEEWHTIHQQLERHISDFRAWFTPKIQNPGGFQM